MSKLQIKSLSPKGITILALLAAIVACGLRFHQYSNNLDPDTGFWLSKDLSFYILYGIIAAVIVLSFLICRVAGSLPPAKFQATKNIPIGFTALLLAFGLAYDGVVCLRESYTLITEFSVGQTLTLFVSSGFMQTALECIFAFCSAVYFVNVGISACKGTVNYQNNKMLATAPVLWGIFRMLVFFVEPISYRNVSQLLFELVYLAFFVIFALSFARIASDVNGENSMWLLFFSGISATFMACLCALVPFFLTITASSSLLAEDYPFRPEDLAFALFGTALLLHLIRKPKQEEPTKEIKKRIPEDDLPAPAKLFTPADPEADTVVIGSLNSGTKTIPSDKLKVKNKNPKGSVLKR